MTTHRVQCPVPGCFSVLKNNPKNVGVHLHTQHPELTRKEHDAAWTKMIGVPPNCPKYLRPRAGREASQ